VVPQTGAAVTGGAASGVVPAIAKWAAVAKPTAEDVPRQTEEFDAEENKVEEDDEPWCPASAPIPVNSAASCQRERRPRHAQRRVNKVKISSPNRFKL
jgi:hypothetical protein